MSGPDTILNCRPGGGSVGDPHLLTFDGLLYDLHAVGEFVLATDDETFVVQVRQKAWGGCAAVNSSVAAMLGTSRIGIYANEDPPLRIDGVPTAILCSAEATGTLRVMGVGGRNCAGSVELAGGAKVELINTDGVPTYDLLEANGGSGVRVAIRAGTHLDLSLAQGNSTGEASPTVGLLGSRDGSSSNDLRTRDGRVMPQPISFEQLYGDFAESWRVTQEESLFDYGPGENTSTFTERSFPGAPCPPLTEDKRLAAERTCQAAGITNGALLDACIFDVGVTGDATFADSFSGAPEPNATLAVLPNAVESFRHRDDGMGNGCACSVRAQQGRATGSLVAIGLALLSLRCRCRHSRRHPR